ncbi:MAG: hypothetical protein KatS3mg060_2288 [Dehalococcoidia bacterium]|nr:MAG: hypothetical protein KatS3mg060_2288 [Dehalococcoidia bacterium]
MDAAIKHCTTGVGIWEWASNDEGGEPDVVLACAGDVPTLETLAAVDPAAATARSSGPGRERGRPHDAAAAERAPARASDREFDTIFTTDKPIDLRLPRLPVARSTA